MAGLKITRNYTFGEKSWELRSFAEIQLSPSREYTTNGQTLANEVFNLLRRYSGYVDRVCISGSMGKRTCLGDAMEPDFDLVIFCNHKTPPFKAVLDDFRQILVNYLPRGSIIDVDQYLIKLQLDGFFFDLCPAPNFAFSMGPDAVKRDLQRQEIHTMIRNSPNPATAQAKFSTGLAESAVQFLKHQSTFTHSVVRLAKYWNSKVKITQHIAGRTLLIECVAIQASHEAQNLNENMYWAFRAFLQKMLHFDSIHCVFLTGNYNSSEIPVNTRHQRPLILDPANPWNNLASNVNCESSAAFRQKAKITLSLLGRIGQLPLNQILVGESTVLKHS